MNNIAKTIINQIKTLDPWAMSDWGATQKGFGENYIRFKSSGMVKWKGFVQINYNAGSDLYDIEFFRIWKYQKKTDAKIEGVFCDQLVSVIDDAVLRKDFS